MKLKAAAHTTAANGGSTRVATTVAIELAASWKPLTKSNSSATAMTEPEQDVATSSGVLHGDRRDEVRDVLEAVERFLQLADDVLPPQHRERLVVARVQLGQPAPVDAVTLGLGGVDLVDLAAAGRAGG